MTVHIALATFQETPEREVMNLQWFWWGEGRRRGAGFWSLKRYEGTVGKEVPVCK